MNQFFSVRGTLEHGHVGQICYYQPLRQTIHHLEIRCSFNKQYYDRIPEAALAELSRTLQLRSPGWVLSEPELDRLAAGLKTEIQIEALLDQRVIGGMHNQQSERTLIWSPGFTSPGCQSQTEMSGLLCVSLLVFNVLSDQTQYTLEVFGE